MFLDLCPPAFIYLIFSCIQICIDSFNGLIKIALTKIFVMIFVTFLLNTLCGAGLSIISWIIVLIPFLYMIVSVSILLYVFGINISKSKLPTPAKESPQTLNCHTEIKQNWEVYRGNIVWLPSYSPQTVC